MLQATDRFEGITVPPLEEITTRLGKKIKIPCLSVKLVDADMVVANDYNPNKVPADKMELLGESIRNAGFCFPIVTSWDETKQKYVIIDGYHRYTTLTKLLKFPKLPIVVLWSSEEDKLDADSKLSKRVLGTYALNQAKGSHEPDKDADMIKTAIKNGATDQEVMDNFGLAADALHRYKQLAGDMSIIHNTNVDETPDVSTYNWEESEASPELPFIHTGLGEDIAIPCLVTKLVPRELVELNDYNPNHVSDENMKLLCDSIEMNGMLFPIVTYWDTRKNKYVVIDGAHRTMAMSKKYLDFRMIPIVIVGTDKVIKTRPDLPISRAKYYLTLSFNKARGAHSLEGNEKLITMLRELGLEETEIMQHMGLSADTLALLDPLKNVLTQFKDCDWNQAWEIADVESFGEGEVAFGEDKNVETEDDD